MFSIVMVEKLFGAEIADLPAPVFEQACSVQTRLDEATRSRGHCSPTDQSRHQTDVKFRFRRGVREYFIAACA
jgi:hypothetical protein